MNILFLFCFAFFVCGAGFFSVSAAADLSDAEIASQRKGHSLQKATVVVISTLRKIPPSPLKTAIGPHETPSLCIMALMRLGWHKNDPYFYSLAPSDSARYLHAITVLYNGDKLFNPEYVQLKVTKILTSQDILRRERIEYLDRIHRLSFQMRQYASQSVRLKSTRTLCSVSEGAPANFHLPFACFSPLFAPESIEDADDGDDSVPLASSFKKNEECTSSDVSEGKEEGVLKMEDVSYVYKILQEIAGPYSEFFELSFDGQVSQFMTILSVNPDIDAALKARLSDSDYLSQIFFYILRNKEKLREGGS